MKLRKFLIQAKKTPEGEAVVVGVVGERQDAVGSDATKRPQITDIIGGGLQQIFQGIVKAPGNIANRVQGIVNALLRRPAAAAQSSQTTAAPSKE